jgi:hypothetical protein
MGQSYRIRTEVGINKTINVPLEQDFEFLEILSLQIQQTDIYERNCADYGVVVGRVTANNGFGIPNARVSVFIPITSVDESNPLISSIYPYKSPEDKNEDGFRYNLLPYEKSYSTHAATGTLPTRLDVLTDPTVIEIFDKYYKLSAKTNDSGDYMIMGVPIGQRTLVMDVDLSDIGEFSLTPQDLIRMGLATEDQVAGNRFRTSNDLNSLPQLINLVKDVEILPLWGDPDTCRIAITRTDFDLRDDANVDIQPTSVFMGSIYSSPDKFRIRAGITIGSITIGGCKPKDNLGNLCELIAGPGQILAIRQTIDQDIDGNPVLEQFQLEQSGNIIDGDGTWLTELPMNLDYFITNEFGEKVLSNDQTIGIPTKGKYRFKVKWQQPPTLTEQTRRPYYLVPNVKEYGWSLSAGVDPNFSSPTSIENRRLSSSYYFGLAWSGYTDGFTGQQNIDRLTEIINCEDTFYEFQFNRVYTVSGLIDQWKKGSKGRFIGIKEIDDDTCSSTVNKFPVNDGFRNFDFLFFLFSILMTILQPTFFLMLVVSHILLFIYQIVNEAICLICESSLFGWLCGKIGIQCNRYNIVLRFPMITYPECQACECRTEYSTSGIDLENQNVSPSGKLVPLSLPDTYIGKFSEVEFPISAEVTLEPLINAEAMAGLALNTFKQNPNVYKLPLSQNVQLSDQKFYHTSSKSLPLGERINIFNSRKNYFDGINKVKIKVEPKLNVGVDKFHYDNTIVILSNEQYNSGDLLTMVNPSLSSDINWLYSADTIDGIVTGISGTSYTTNAATQITIAYASNQSTSQSVQYNLPYGSDQTNYKFPADIEYFQVVTAITWNDIQKIWNPNTLESFPNILSANTEIVTWKQNTFWYEFVYKINYSPIKFVSDIENKYVLVLQRGVDPYSPKYIQQYSLGNIFGTNESDPNFTFTAQTKLNIPIQINSSSSSSIQDYNQAQMFFQSYFFRPGINGNTQNGYAFSGYNTTNTGYYGLLNNSNFDSTFLNPSGNQIISKTSNGFYLSSPSGSKYDLSEDLSGLGAMGSSNYNDSIFAIHPKNNYQSYFGYNYYTKTIYKGISSSAMTITDNVKNVLRTDRLPSSDVLDGGDWNINPSLLQQNNNFAIYQIFESSTDITFDSPGYTTGADVVTPDIEGIVNSGAVLESFNCETMVSLSCYEGFGSQFKVNTDCSENDGVERGCYLFLRRPIFDLIKDIGNFSEWSYRFRFFFGLCRGVLSQSFMNNWVSGSLYAFPIQVDTFYDKQNKPFSKYCMDLIHYDIKTTNFYYRSSPYDDSLNKFIGKPTVMNSGAVNKKNLLYPTTIINLGMKDSYFNELSFDASTRAYIMSELDSTSYGDTSDLINLFVISRITDEGFLKRILSIGDNSLNQLFSRGNEGLIKNRRIDGDLAQLMSINSELGVIKFSPEYYEVDPDRTINPTTILGTSSNPAIAVWFSSTTENLQTKDYLTPGRIDFRATPTSNFTPFNFGIKSQLVPFYRWEINSSSQTIFGNQYNNWKTDTLDILQYKMQSLDRMTLGAPPMYFQSTTSPKTNDLNNRGYIFSVDGNNEYSPIAAQTRSFIVGAPFHFYFGVVKGNSSLDKFKTKYSVVE